MNKEPLGLYIFRFVIGLGLLVFLLMLYWSSTLIESDVKDLLSDVTQIKNELSEIQSQVQQLKRNGISQTEDQKKKESNRSQIDSSLPNLLEEDPFYNKTLPTLLGPDFHYKGIFHRAALGRPTNLHPFTNWRDVSDWRDLCVPAAARLKFGRFETMSPNLAIKMEERKNASTGKPEFWVHLRENVYWEPLSAGLFSEDIKLAPHFLHRHPVTAHDFKFYFDAMQNPFNQEPGAVALRTLYNDVEEVEVIDDLTFVVRWKAIEEKDEQGQTFFKTKYIAKALTGASRPLPIFVYQYFADGKKILDEDADPNTYRTNSVWAQNFSQHWAKNIIISCGAWVFTGMSDRQIQFKRNPNHYFAYDALAEGIEVQFKDSFDAMWQQFKANQLDDYELRPEQLTELEAFLKSPQYQEQNSRIHRLDYLARSYAYVGWNETKPYFNNKKLRQALAMAIDRQRIIHHILNENGIEINGTFFFNSPAYDHSIEPWPYDPQRARLLLEEEGWYDSNGDGIIDKVIDGKSTPFEFNLMYYVRAHTGKAIAENIATSLREIGILCHLQGVDIADLSATFDNKGFDALLMMWALSSPPDDPRQLWHSSGSKEKGSSNAIGFANKEIDEIIDALAYESNPEKRKKLYHRFDAIIHEEAPYTFLYTPKVSMVYRDYLKNVFIPSERQDLIPGADISQPDSSIYYLKH